MELIQWATSPWGKSVPIHIAWSLIWIAVIFGFCFMVVHSLYLIIVKPPKRFAERKAEAAAGVPDRVPRHSLAARLFHWVMAASMITLLITAFLPKVGIQFNWVVYHWIAGLVLTASILFHVVHSTFFLDFWSIWPDRTDLTDAKNRTLRFFGKDAPLPSKFAKYPLENKLYHGSVMLAG
ncbi:MAG: cytochrome b/b6 domain-containing protein, partial [Terracidiphilus sp.]